MGGTFSESLTTRVFHVKHPGDPSRRTVSDVSRETVDNWSSGTDPLFRSRLAELLGDLDASWTNGQIEALARYRRWLIDEAIPAGGLGPNEEFRLFDRHLADSLMYLRGVPDSETSMVDVGSGVGLPGIPVAIGRPRSRVTVLDRAERRTVLARRAVRVLALDNVDVVTRDINQAGTPQEKDVFDVALFRASLPIPQAAVAFRAIASDVGIGLLGVSRLPEPPEIPDPPPGVHFTLTAEESSVLDSPFWLLRMRTI